VNNARDRVIKALEKLCASKPSPGQILFSIHFSAADVAEEAGVSVTTARNYLNRLSMCRGYRRTFIRGTYGYRFDADYA